MMKCFSIKTDKGKEVLLEIADDVPLAVVLRGVAREPGLLTPENEAKIRRAFGVADDA
jgi:hypothetical protein